jgi:hypothetical protein
MKRIYEYFKKKQDCVMNGSFLGRLVLIATGLAATIWFLVRVIPKPVRATYPCMQAAAPVMSAFTVYLLSLFGGLAAVGQTRKYIASGKFGRAMACVSLVVVCSVAFLFNDVRRVFAQTEAKETVNFVLSPNTPRGEAKGIHPGRVVWAYAPGTAAWDESDNYWFDDKYNNQANCDRLIARALTSLTGESDEAKAWNALFLYFNEKHGKGNAPYKRGEKIAIKINQNNTYSHDESEEINATPQMTLSLLRSLINKAGIPQESIALIEPSRHLTNFIYNKCVSEFPHIIYVDNGGGEGRVKTSYVDNAIPYSQDNGKLATGLSTYIVESDYNINMSLLKGHGGQGVTLCGKNWYGVTDIHPNWRMNAHNGFNQKKDGSPVYLTFVDFMGHKDLGGKTLVYFIDGLYGSKTVDKKPSGKWKMQPFNNDWPNSLFASQDPVAIDAVGVDFLSTEFPDMDDADYSDSYLLEAALAGNPPSGVVYDPERDGVRLTSLGVVEHWNNPVDKQYSRNLGKNDGIELVYELIR